MTSSPAGPKRPGLRLLAVILTLTLVRGMIYLAIVPPWQHYDEPTHFEYVRLINELGRLPRPEDYDLALRREIAASMESTGFWGDSGPPPIDYRSSSPPDIGISELLHPALYYVLLAAFQPLVAHQTVESQLYLARLGSVLLGVVLVAAAHGLTTELVAKRQGRVQPGRWHRGRWQMLPVAIAVFVALLPPLTDLMSGVNNDVGAAAAVSLLLWASMRLIRRGPSPRRVVVVLVLAAACLAIKNTAGAVALVTLVVLGGGYVPRQHWPRLLIALAGLVLVATVAIFSWGEHAAYWQSRAADGAPNRVTDDGIAGDLSLGSSAFVLSSHQVETTGSSMDDAGAEHPPRVIHQELGWPVTSRLHGRTVSLGAWIKAPDGPRTVLLTVLDGPTAHRVPVQATSEWQFHVLTATLGTISSGAAVRVGLPNDGSEAATAYVDGIVLVAGVKNASPPPSFDSALARGGQWGSEPFRNLVRNGSAEKVWPGLRPWIRSLRVYKQPAMEVLHSVLDWRRSGWVYRYELMVLLQTFWGRFGWNHIGLPDAYIYFLLLMTLAGGVSAGLFLIRRMRVPRRTAAWRWHAVVLLGAALIAGWGGAILRIHPVWASDRILWPVARYAFLVVIPTVLALCIGWVQIVPSRWLKEAAWAGLLGLIALDAIAIWTVILPYYYG